MTLTQHAPPEIHLARAAKRTGYVISVFVNGALLFVVNNLLSWGFPSFLTQDFEKVLPVVNISLVAGIVFSRYDEARITGGDHG